MKSKKENSFFSQFREYLNYGKGPLIGSAVTLAVSPGLNWTNHVLNDKKMVWKNCMKGAFTNASSAFPSYAVVFTTKHFLKENFKSDSLTAELFSSFGPGALAGFIQTPFDVVAQNKQLSKQSTESIPKLIVKTNGYKSLFQGAGITMLREGCWSALYLSVLSMASKQFQTRGMNKNQADFWALLLTAGSYGVFSTPLYQFRYKKQLGLTEPNKPKSYLEHAKDIYNQKPNVKWIEKLGFFFKGAIPRTLTVTLAAGALYKAGELYEEVVNGKSKR